TTPSEREPTWTPITGTAPRSDADFWSYVNSIAVSANGIALASTSSGIARSADGGQTWAQVYPVGSATVTSYDVVFDPNSPNDAVADIDQGTVVYSTDGGQTWAKGIGFPSYTSAGERVSLAFNPAVRGSVYALVDNSPRAQPSGEIFHSIDGGKTWVLLAGTGAFQDYQSGATFGALCAGGECQGGYDNTIIVIPVAGSAPTIVTGGVIIFRSKDGGATWSDAEWGVVGGGYHPDIHAFAYDA
ncbi:BNR repeat-containing glycosyl hydrolase, partial [mine drainage metagenome]